MLSSSKVVHNLGNAKVHGHSAQGGHLSNRDGVSPGSKLDGLSSISKCLKKFELSQINLKQA